MKFIVAIMNRIGNSNKKKHENVLKPYKYVCISYCYSKERKRKNEQDSKMY